MRKKSIWIAGMSAAMVAMLGAPGGAVP